MKQLLLIILLIVLSTLFATEHFTKSHEMNDVERLLWESYNTKGVRTEPPTAPVRPIAEWEPMTAVLVSYYYGFGIPTSVIAEIAEDLKVIILIPNTSYQSSVTNMLQNANVNMDNIEFKVHAIDSYWTRDYGPWFIETSNEEIGIVNFDYNRPRPNDDQIPEFIAEEYGYDYYSMDLVQTGGNYMNDGMFSAVQSHIAYTENSNYSNEEVNQMMEDYLGITNYHVLQDPNGEYINHVDCWGKFLAPDKILIRSVSTNHSQYDELEETAAYFENAISAYGTPYQVYRVYTPNDQPYTNSLIINNKVLVPIMNSSYDDEALATYEEAMPGYEIIGFTPLASDPWMGTDALHCRTHEIADINMLRIYHSPIVESSPDYNYEISANITAFSGQNLYEDSLKVYYKINDADVWQSSQLTNVTRSEYYTNITLLPGEKISYYIHAADESGRSENNPYIGADDPHEFISENDETIIIHEPIYSLEFDDGILNTPITTEVIDDTGISSVKMRYYFSENQDSEPSEIYETELMNTEDNFWEVNEDQIFCPYYNSGTVTYFGYQFVATDSAYEPKTTIYPAENEFTIVEYYLISNDNNVTNQIPTMLYNNYPNPFNPTTSISFNLNRDSHVNLQIFNIKGQVIKTLVNDYISAGIHKVTWDGKNENQNTVSTGIYFYKLITPNYSETKKMILIK